MCHDASPPGEASLSAASDHRARIDGRPEQVAKRLSPVPIRPAASAQAHRIADHWRMHSHSVCTSRQLIIGVCYLEVKGCRDEDAESIGYGLVGRTRLMVMHPLAMVPHPNSPDASVRITAKDADGVSSGGSSSRTIPWNESAPSRRSMPVKRIMISVWGRIHSRMSGWPCTVGKSVTMPTGPGVLPQTTNPRTPSAAHSPREPGTGWQSRPIAWHSQRSCRRGPDGTRSPPTPSAPPPARSDHACRVHSVRWGRGSFTIAFGQTFATATDAADGAGPHPMVMSRHAHPSTSMESTHTSR
jgi:hypothetical protein